MPASHERTPYEKETLIFSNPEAAQDFAKTVEQGLQTPQSEGVNTKREVIGEALAQEFAAQGESVALLRTPWEHTPQEHAEVQHLVDVAFAKDLPSALALARQSPHYPRNLDLLHDVLTGQMYELLHKSGVRQQPLFHWIIGVVIVVFILITVVVSLYVF